MKNPKFVRIGVSSRIEKNDYFIVLDYDTKTLEYVIADCERLQRKFRLSGCYIFRTSRGRYAAAFFCHVNRLLHNIIMFNADIDVFHRKYSVEDGRAILRVSNKQEKKSGRLKLVKYIEGYTDEDIGIREQFMKVLCYEGQRKA
jgi:hypothetical protein